MNTKRLIHLIALTCLLPALTGCATRSTVDLSTDPAGIPDQLASGERVEVEGFTRAGGEHVKWKGHVSFVPPDSLRFEAAEQGPRPKPATFGRAPEPGPAGASFTVSVEALDSLEVPGRDDLTTSIMLVPVAAVGLALVLTGAILLGGGTLMP